MINANCLIQASGRVKNLLGRMWRTGSLQQSSQAHCESLDARVMLAADIAISMVDNVPSFVVPGDKLTLAATVSNQGDEVAKGPVTVRFLAPVNNADDPVDVVATVTKNMNLRPGQTTVIKVKIVVGDDPAPGVYNYGATVSASESINESTENDESIIVNGFDLKLIFGTYGDRRNVVLTTADADGTIATFSLKGAGYGEFDPALNENDRAGLGIIGSDGNSNFTIATRGGDKQINLDNDINIAGSLKQFVAKGVNFTGSIAVGGTLGSFTVNDMSDMTMLVAGNGAGMKFKAASIINLALESATPITQMDFASWEWLSNPDDSEDSQENASMLTAPWIGKLNTKGEFSAVTSLSGLGASKATLSQAKIGGIFSGQMSIHGNVGSLTATTMDQGMLVASGTVNSVSVTNAVNATFWVRNLVKLDVGTAGIIEVGAGAIFDATGLEALSQGNASVITWGSGSIGAINVKGTIEFGRFAAGVDPVNTTFLDDDDRNAGSGIISKIDIKGQAGDVLFAASGFPSTVKIGGQKIVTSNDDRFFTLDTPNV